MDFQWDHAKEASNLAKHGVDFVEAQQAFLDDRAIVLFDVAHSTATELRWWLIGRVGTRIMQVRYTRRHRGVIRIIGAGYWRKGREFYEDYWKQRCPEAGL
jgi:uncharacterized DUF497 family protein